MSVFRPKKEFALAKAEEKQGNLRTASHKYAKIAVFLLGEGKAKEARILLERAVKLAPRSPRLFVQLAICYMKLAKKEEAMGAIEQFSRVSERQEKTAQYRQFAEVSLKSYPELREVYYQSILELDRTQVFPFLGLARAQMEQQHWKEAQKTLIEAIRARLRDESLIPLLREVLEVQQATELLFYVNRFEQGKLSVEDLASLLEGGKRKETSGPSHSFTTSRSKDLNQLIDELESQLGIELEDPRDSIEPLLTEFRTRAADIIQDDAKSQVDMAMAYFHMGLTEVAEDELAKVQSTDPKYIDAQFILGELYFSQGSDLSALDVYQRCLREPTLTKSMAVEAKYKLVQLYGRLGDHRQALEIAKEISKTNPQYRQLKGLIKELMRILSGDRGEAA